MGRARPPAHPHAKLAACPCADPPDPAVRDSHAVSDLELGGYTTLAVKEGRLPLSGRNAHQLQAIILPPAQTYASVVRPPEG